MPRRRQSTLEDLLDLAALLPWWVAIILAVASYLALQAVSQVPMPAASGGHVVSEAITGSYLRALATAGQYILPMIFFFGAVVSAAKTARNRRLLADAKRTADDPDLLNLSWQDFERLVGQAFRERGFAVAETNAGPDGSVDLELQKDGELHLVQCKRWRARKVGVEIVRELYGVMSARGAVGGYVVSFGEFSDEATRFAAGRNIDLWDGPKLKAVIRGVQDRRHSSRSSDHVSAKPIRRTPTVAEVAAPACPTCGTTMVKRMATRGAKSGQPFWGCPRYPDCRGTRPIPTA